MKVITKKPRPKVFPNPQKIHLEKAPVRLFYKYFSPEEYQILRAVYLTLCALNKEFGKAPIPDFLATVAAQAAIPPKITSCCLRAMAHGNILFGRRKFSRRGGRYTGTSIIVVKHWKKRRCSADKEKRTVEALKSKLMEG